MACAAESNRAPSLGTTTSPAGTPGETFLKSHHQILRMAMISTFAITAVYAAPQNGTATPPIDASPRVSNDTIDWSGAHSQVVATTDTADGIGNETAIRSVQAGAMPDAPKPSFDSLDTNHDGFISASEAEAYSPLANDYLHVAQKGSRGVTKAEYGGWH